MRNKRVIKLFSIAVSVATLTAGMPVGTFAAQEQPNVKGGNDSKEANISTFTDIKGKAADTAKASKSPKTSDTSKTFGLAGAFAAGLAAIGATLFFRKKKMSNTAEKIKYFRLYRPEKRHHAIHLRGACFCFIFLT